MRRSLLLALAVQMLPGIAIAASFNTLGDLLGGSAFSRALGISADGSVVVGDSVAEFGNRQAFRWTAAGGMVGLGTLPSPFPFGGSSYAYGVSGDGSVIVGTSDGAPGGGFRWTASGGMQPLIENPNGLGPNGVSQDGSVVVGKNNNTDQAFRWTSAGGLEGLGDLSGGINRSIAKGVSADGAVIVGEGTVSDDFTSEAFRWTAAGGMVGLGDIPSLGIGSMANAASADGAVVVGVGNASIGSREAFRWTETNGMVGLGDLPGGGVGSEARAVSADGSVVVGISWTSNGPGGNSTDEAFIWTEGGGMRRLFDVLVEQGVTGLEGWILLDATGVSADGSAVVGMAEAPNGIRSAYLAKVSLIPIPAAVWLFGSALGVLGWMRRKVNRQ